MRSKLLWGIGLAAPLALLIALLGIVVNQSHAISDLRHDVAAAHDREQQLADDLDETKANLDGARTDLEAVSAAANDTTTVTGLSTRLQKLEHRMDRVCPTTEVRSYTSNLSGQETSMGNNESDFYFTYFQNLYSLVSAVCGYYGE